MVISASVEVIYIEPESQRLVYIDREVTFETLLTVYLITCLVVGKVGVWDVAVGIVDIFGPEVETVQRV